jgi:hypothetical protein
MVDRSLHCAAVGFFVSFQTASASPFWFDLCSEAELAASNGMCRIMSLQW